MRIFDICCLIFSVARIALVKPEKSRGVEDVILRAAQMGQIIEKVTFCISLFGSCIPLNVCKDLVSLN